MMSNAIQIEGLSKKYFIGHSARKNYPTLRDQISAGVKSIALQITGKLNREANSTIEEFWALRDVEFDIAQGERIGIIGRNGAGKSTLLKILSRITEPTRGRARINGRVASLLEVGTGFHPELTGRENIFLNGAILGMRKSEIIGKLDEIVEFAEVARFLDTPVKRYSSGMYVRLAFSVAAHLEPEILIVDEVLSVGDISFQRKCLGRLGNMGNDGRTVLFVSHNMTALKGLCDKLVWLDNGTVREMGETESVIARYTQDKFETCLDRVWNDEPIESSDSKIKLHALGISFDGQESGSNILVTTPINMNVEFSSYHSTAELNISVLLFDSQDNCVFNSISQPQQFKKGRFGMSLKIPGNFLNDGVYRVRLLIVKDQGNIQIDVGEVVSFEVHDSRDFNWYGKWQGIVRPNFDWTINHTRSLD